MDSLTASPVCFRCLHHQTISFFSKLTLGPDCFQIFLTPTSGFIGTFWNSFSLCVRIRLTEIFVTSVRCPFRQLRIILTSSQDLVAIAVMGKCLLLNFCFVFAVSANSMLSASNEG